jgi:glycine C-acetyltransferase
VSSTPPPDPLGHLADDLAQVRAQGLYRPLRVMSSANRTRVTVDGREAITLASNNYLGLNTHPRLIEAALDAVRRFGAGSGAVRTISGTMSLHEELEAELARFKHVEATLTFQSGFTCNTGVIPVVAGEPDLIVSDAFNHASIIDGMRLSKAPRVIYRHKDVAHLRELLATARREGRADGQPYRAILVVTDGVFSMDGDIAPLPAIVAAAEEHGAAVFVDDAHASGVLGRNGRGSVDHFDLHGRVAIQVGTLSKAMGVLGGYVAGSQTLREMLVQRARPFLFSTSHPPAVAAACLAAIHVLEDEPELIERLWSNTRRFKAELARLGFDTGVSETPITPVMVGDSATAIRFADRLLDEGVWATSVVYPTVALDGARLRTIVTAAHSDDELDTCLAAFDRVGRELGLIAG